MPPSCEKRNGIEWVDDKCFQKLTSWTRWHEWGTFNVDEETILDYFWLIWQTWLLDALCYFGKGVVLFVSWWIEKEMCIYISLYIYVKIIVKS